jgi:hypothetical protein
MVARPQVDRMPGLLTRVLVPIAVAGAAGVLAFNVGRHGWSQHRSAHWPSAEGYILESEAVPHDPDDPLSLPTHRLSYSYRVGTHWYEGTRYTAYGPVLSWLRSGGPSGLEEAYPVGAAVEVAYDPERPTLAVLSAGTTTGERVIVAVVLATLAGVALPMLGMALRELSSGRPAGSAEGQIVSLSSAAAWNRGPAGQTAGPIRPMTPSLKGRPGRPSI